MMPPRNCCSPVYFSGAFGRVGDLLGTPEPILKAYRDAFAKMNKGAEFLEKGRKMSEDFEPQQGADVEGLLKTLGNTTPDALDYINKMLKGQGIG
jgi:hypothetical protein